MPDFYKLRALRNAHREEMPPRFRFSMMVITSAEGCGSVGCSLGLAIAVGLTTKEEVYSTKAGENCEKIFNVTPEQSRWLFFPEQIKGDLSYSYDTITPAIQADRIDRMIAHLEAGLEGVPSNG